MAAWPKILVKNVFRPAGSGEFCAVMEVEGKRSIMKTGEKSEVSFFPYESTPNTAKNIKKHKVKVTGELNSRKRTILR